MVAIRSKGLCPACRARELPPKERTAIRVKAKPKGRSLSIFFWRSCGKIKYGKKIPYGDVYTMPRSRQYMPLIS